MQNNLLVLGPLKNKTHRKGSGGVIVLMDKFFQELNIKSINYNTIDTNKNNYPFRFISLISVYIQFFLTLKNHKVISLHGTATDFFYIAPFVLFISRLLGKKVILRKFAGSFIEVYENAPVFKKALARFALTRSDANFFETKYLVKYFESFNANTFWYPNVRENQVIKRSVRPYTKKFIFLGHVRKEKGILELIKAANSLPNDYQIDVFGTMIGSLENQISASKANYKGTLKPEEVTNKLIEYDVLVLPTFWSGEGYPGVIIEAFSVGLPVVATSLEGIKEIVTDGENGLLVEPKNVEQLVGAMRTFNTENYPKFSVAAKKSFAQFDSAIVTRDFLLKIGLLDEPEYF